MATNAAVAGGLDKQAITLDNHLTVEASPFDVFPEYGLSMDITGPEAEVPSGESAEFLTIILQIIILPSRH